MHIVRTIVLGVIFTVIASTAFAASGPRIPPGGPAPKPLIGTWTTRLTAADVAKAPVQSDMPVDTLRWRLVIANTGVGSSPRVLGLRPVGPLHSGPSIPFGVQGRLIHLECLDNGPGLPIAGHDTFTWFVSGSVLRLKAVRVHCKNSFDRNRVIVLVSEPWRHVR